MPLSLAEAWGGFETGGVLRGENDYNHFVNASDLTSIHHHQGNIVLRISGFRASLFRHSKNCILVNYHERAINHEIDDLIRITGELPTIKPPTDFSRRFSFHNACEKWVVFDGRYDGDYWFNSGAPSIELEVPLGSISLWEACVVFDGNDPGREITALQFA